MGFFRAGRATSDRDLLLRGFVVLALLAALVCGLALKLNGVFSDAVPVTAQVTSAGGAIRSGVDVKMRGMVVGEVSAVTGDAHQVELSLELDKQQVDLIPSEVRARILPASVFGTSYVDLVVPGRVDASRAIQAGDIVREDASQETLELQVALDSIESLIEALGPAELQTALHTVGSVLDGRGDDLGRTLDTLDRYTRRFEPMIPQLRRDLRLLAVNLDAVARNAPGLLDATDNTLVALKHFVQRRAKVTALLGGAATLMQDTRTLLTTYERQYLEALSHSVTIVDALYDERGGVRDTLISTGNTSTKLLSVLENGYARVEGYIHPRGPEDYTRGDCPRYGSRAGGNCG